MTCNESIEPGVPNTAKIQDIGSASLSSATTQSRHCDGTCGERPLHATVAATRMMPARLDFSENRMLRHSGLPACLVAFVVSTAFAANWPQWRGPAGDGSCPDANLPLKWSETENVAWKCPLPDGASTPVIWDNAVFATGQDREKLMLFRIDRDDGKVVWSQQVGTGRFQNIPEARRGIPHRNPLYSLAAPSPVTDGEVVVAHFGNGDLAAYDYAGKQLWKHNLQSENGPYTIWWGHANSPVLVGDLVINVCMQDSLADLSDKKQVDSYLVAHDKRTGVQRLENAPEHRRAEEQADAYTTPLLCTVDGRRELVVMGGNQLDAYDPVTGKQIWYLPGLVGGRTVTGPTIGGGLIFRHPREKRMRWWRSEPRARVAWRRIASSGDTRGTPPTVPPLSTIMACCSGLWTTASSTAWTRPPGNRNGTICRCLPGDYKPSPIVADGRLYFLNISGRCTVLAAAAKFEKLAENSIADARRSASPPAADGRPYIRGRKWLYCIKS